MAILSICLTHEVKRVDMNLALFDIDITQWRTAPPPSRYINIKLSEEGGGSGTKLPEAARPSRKHAGNEHIKDTPPTPEEVKGTAQ